MSAQPSLSRIRVRYADTDRMGIVYYANYFVWFEVGRTDLLRAGGWSYRDMEQEGFSLPVIEAQCRYKRPAEYDDELLVRTAGSLLSPVRVRFEYEVMRDADRMVLAQGLTVHASLGRDQRPRAVPDRVRALLAGRSRHTQGGGQAAEGGAPRTKLGETTT